MRERCADCGSWKTTVRPCVACGKRKCGCCNHPSRLGRVCNVECFKVAEGKQVHKGTKQ